MTYSTKDLLQEVRREISLRKHVYPKLIEQGRLRQFEATSRLLKMEQVAMILEERLAREQEAQPDLFGEATNDGSATNP